MSRAGVSAASLLAGLCFAGAAQATLYPAPGPLKPFKLAELRSTSGRAIVSCSLHGVGAHGSVGKIEKKLGPVACEHPPRSQPLDGNFVFGP